MKLYYMMGLPTETLEDLDGIAKIARGVVDVWRKTSNNRARGVRVTGERGLLCTETRHAVSMGADGHG